MFIKIISKKTWASQCAEMKNLKRENEEKERFNKSIASILYALGSNNFIWARAEVENLKLSTDSELYKRMLQVVENQSEYYSETCKIVHNLEHILEISIQSLTRNLKSEHICFNLLLSTIANMSISAKHFASISTNVQNEQSLIQLAETLVQSVVVDIKQSIAVALSFCNTTQNVKTAWNTLSDISLKMHLVNLNGHIEAARAGSAGDCFSIVMIEAQDVKKEIDDAIHDDVLAKIDDQIVSVQTSLNSLLSHAEELALKASSIGELSENIGSTFFEISDEYTELVNDLQKIASNDLTGLFTSYEQNIENLQGGLNLIKTFFEQHK